MTEPLRVAVADLEAEIDALFREYPELAEDEDLRADMLEGSTEFHEVMERLYQRRADAEGMVEACREREKSLASRRHRFESQRDAMGHIMHRLMDRTGKRKHTLPEATMSLRAVPPKVAVIDETAVPEAFQRVTVKPDLTAIKAALKDGKDVPGARLTNGGETIAFRRT